MLRASWKGRLRLSLVTVPVQAISAQVAGGGEVHFHQLHESCHSRIQYKKICPKHGEVAKNEIVRGFEYAKDKYVIVDPEELDSLLGEREHVIEIDTFVAPEAIDVRFLDGRSFYLVADGAAGQKPYALLRQAMLELERIAVARCMIAGRSQLVAVRTVDDLLVMTILKFASQLRSPDDVREQVKKVNVSAAELKLARTLIASSTAKHFDLADYHDDYTVKLQELIDAKAGGREIVAAPAEEPPPIINLMDALRKSVNKTKGPAPGARKSPIQRQRLGESHAKPGAGTKAGRKIAGKSQSVHATRHATSSTERARRGSS